MNAARWLAAIAMALLLASEARADALDDAKRGNELFAAGELDQALQAFDQAIGSGELSGGVLATALNNRGVVLGELGELDRAIADYDLALELRPDDPNAARNKRIALTRRGAAFAFANDHARAFADYDAAIALDPRAAQPYLRRGELLALRGAHAAALDDLLQAERLEPDNAEIREAISRVRAGVVQAEAAASSTSPVAAAPLEPRSALPAELATQLPTGPAAEPPAAPAPAQSTAPPVADRLPAAEPAAPPPPPPSAPVVAATPQPAAEPPRVAGATAEPPPSETSGPTATATGPAVGRLRAVTAVNVRAQPRNEAAAISVLREGQIVDELGEELGWKRVRLDDGRAGFVFRRFLEPVGEG
jgi:Flp pilus assembly protein TadD